jgi:hypothetical protein
MVPETNFESSRLTRMQGEIRIAQGTWFQSQRQFLGGLSSYRIEYDNGSPKSAEILNLDVYNIIRNGASVARGFYKELIRTAVTKQKMSSQGWDRVNSVLLTNDLSHSAFMDLGRTLPLVQREFLKALLVQDIEIKDLLQSQDKKLIPKMRVESVGAAFLTTIGLLDSIKNEHGKRALNEFFESAAKRNVLAAAFIASVAMVASAAPPKEDPITKEAALAAALARTSAPAPIPLPTAPAAAIHSRPAVRHPPVRPPTGSVATIHREPAATPAPVPKSAHHPPATVPRLAAAPSSTPAPLRPHEPNQPSTLLAAVTLPPVVSALEPAQAVAVSSTLVPAAVAPGVTSGAKDVGSNQPSYLLTHILDGRERGLVSEAVRLAVGDYEVARKILQTAQEDLDSVFPMQDRSGAAALEVPKLADLMRDIDMKSVVGSLQNAADGFTGICAAVFEFSGYSAPTGSGLNATAQVKWNPFGAAARIQDPAAAQIIAPAHKAAEEAGKLLDPEDWDRDFSAVDRTMCEVLDGLEEAARGLDPEYQPCPERSGKAKNALPLRPANVVENYRERHGQPKPDWPAQDRDRG